MITKLAVTWLTWQLRKDKDFWRSYQANIAMAFFDAFNQAQEKSDKGIEPLDLHTVSNEAANNFMKLWTRKDID